MKITKRVLLTVFVLMLVIASVMGAVACTNKNTPSEGEPALGGGTQQESATEVLITLDATVMPDYEGKFLPAYMDVLKEKGLFTYEASESQYGLYITSVNGKAAEGMDWWGVFTDDLTDESVANEASLTYEYNGKTYYMTNVGISSVPLREGKRYLFVFNPPMPY
ncbi:MAG: hypothetical protein J6Y74_06095 [Clostridia bacterium]|nr:hypothetical protein [Clostridia bacterium]